MVEDVVAPLLRGAPSPALPGSGELRLPRLKEHVRLITDGAALRLRSPDRDFVIDRPPAWGRSFLEALDGRSQLPAVAASLREAGWDVPLAELRDTVAQLHELRLVEDAVHDGLLDGRDRARYDRQLRYFGAVAPAGEGAAHGQLRLADAQVSVLGLGALGGHVAQALVAAGVGRTSAVDGDVVELSNLNRQTIYCEADVGRSKATVARERLTALNSSVQFTAERRWLHSRRDVEAAIAGADFVVDAVDSPPGQIERWVNDACFELAIPYIGMSHLPPWIRLGPTYLPGETGCYRCQEVAWRAQDPSFDAGTPRGHPAAVGPTALVAAGLVAMDVIHYLTGIARPASAGAALLVDLRTLSVDRRPIEPCADCPVCGDGRPAAVTHASLRP